MPVKNTHEFLEQAFLKALGAAKPSEILPVSLATVFKNPLAGRCLVLGAGKAAASMAATLEAYAHEHWPDIQLEGMVVTRYGHAMPTKTIQVVEASHPVPDAAGLDAARKTLNLIATLQANDQLIVLISGGGSSLLTLPASGLSIDDVQATTRALLRSGAPIAQMNIVRKHLSAILGGHMAREAVARGAKVDAFLISDVTGDDISSIASGPCAPDNSSFTDALRVLGEYDLLNGQVPQLVIDYLRAGERGDHPETPKSGDPIFKNVRNHLLGSAHASLEAAANYCHSVGVTPVILGDTVTGEAKDVALMQASIAREIYFYNAPFARPVALLSGGECTVTIPPSVKGRGGRCTEFLLALLAATEDLPSLAALAADTDGIDGSEDNAGGWFDSSVRKFAESKKILAKKYLADHDAYGFFKEARALVETGPTLTNVNDFRILLIDSES